MNALFQRDVVIKQDTLALVEVIEQDTLVLVEGKPYLLTSMSQFLIDTGLWIQTQMTMSHHVECM